MDWTSMYYSNGMEFYVFQTIACKAYLLQIWAHVLHTWVYYEKSILDLKCIINQNSNLNEDNCSYLSARPW